MERKLNYRKNGTIYIFSIGSNITNVNSSIFNPNYFNKKGTLYLCKKQNKW